jgi:hypothetical protein
VSGAIVVGAAAGVIYAWVATTLRPFTWPQRVMTGAAAIAIVGLGAYRAGPRLTLSGWWVDWRRLLRREADPAKRDELRLRWRLGSAVWGSLIVAVAVSEVVTLFSSPRSTHPTLSAVIVPALGSHPSRFVAYVLWLALGIGLARR